MKVTFYLTSSGRSPIEDFMEKLSAKDKAKFAEVLSGLLEYGLEYSRAQFKPLRGKIWEIKFKSDGGGYRVAYVMLEKNSMIWLHAFKKKTQKTAKRDLELAEKRMLEVL